MQELPFLHSARPLMLIDICMKFREASLRGFQVTERTRFVTDRQTDGQTDRRPGKNNMSPNPEGRRHNIGHQDITSRCYASCQTQAELILVTLLRSSIEYKD